MNEPDDNSLVCAMADLALEDMAPLLGILTVVAGGRLTHPEVATHFAGLLSDVHLSLWQLDKSAAERVRAGLDLERRRLLDAAVKLSVSGVMLGFLRPGQFRDLMLRDHKEAAAVIGANTQYPEEG